MADRWFSWRTGSLDVWDYNIRWSTRLIFSSQNKSCTLQPEYIINTTKKIFFLLYHYSSVLIPNPNSSKTTNPLNTQFNILSCEPPCWSWVGPLSANKRLLKSQYQLCPMRSTAHSSSFSYHFFAYYDTIFKLILLALKNDFDKNHSEDTVLQKLTCMLDSICITFLFK